MPIKGRMPRFIFPETGQPVSAATVYYSNVLSLPVGSGSGHHIEWDGAITGTFTFWVSNKPQADESTDDDWVQDDDFTISNPAGSSGKAFYHLGNLQAEKCRWRYAHGGGTGTLFGWATSKDP